MSEPAWDDPDPELERLQRALLPLRFEPRPFVFPAPPVRPAARPWGGVFASLAAAAAAALAVAGLGLFSRPSWAVQRLAGAPVAGASVVVERGRLSLGDWLVTDAGSRARLEIGAIGEAVVEPGSRLGLLDSGRRQHRLAMAKGVMHAKIWAPPGKFLVDTPAATAVDLGCEYRLEVDEAGAGRLSVLLGYVGLEWADRESYVPEHAQCLMRPGVGPGTPFYADASAALREAVERLDFDADAGDALARILREARRRDALTLWHLLLRTAPAERARVVDRLAELLPPPRGVTREGVLRGERAMLDSWWDLLEVGSMKFWRRWMRQAPPRPR